MQIKQWRVRGIRNSSEVHQRVVLASTHAAAVHASSKGRGFMLVRDCVLCVDAAVDRIRAVHAFEQYNNSLRSK